MLDDVKARNGWQPQDTIRLIFHVFKDLKDAAAQAVKTLVQSLTTEYAGVEFAFLHIIEDHDWMMYDLSSPGVGEGSKVKGKCVPVRGHAVSDMALKLRNGGFSAALDGGRRRDLPGHARTAGVRLPQVREHVRRHSRPRTHHHRQRPD
jgi:hypothetical protein